MNSPPAPKASYSFCVMIPIEPCLNQQHLGMQKRKTSWHLKQSSPHLLQLPPAISHISRSRQPVLPREGRRRFPSIAVGGGSAPWGLGEIVVKLLPEFPPDSHNLKALEENVCTWAVELLS